MKVKLLLTAITLSCLAIDVLAQVSISGKIVSADTNEPIVGANIRIDQSLSGCTTNGKGEFSISNLPDGKHVLRITHVSYTPKSITTKGGEKNLLIKLQDSFTNIGQVVVTGTGTHHRMTDSPVPVSVITAKDLSNASVTSLDEALQKLTPSFSSMTNGMGTTLSLNGLPDDYFIFLENGKRLYGDDTYARINVAKIKRIEILNGASSALYGTNAIGGVINIITDDAKNAINVSSDTRYASKGRFTQSVNIDVNTGKFGSYTSYRRQQAEGWQLNPYEENSKTHELEENRTIRKIRTVQKEGNREVSRELTFYSLDAIIAVGYRVNSKQATDFRIWATNTLKEYIKKGFVLNDELLKNGPKFGKDYFKELLERIRSIRTSERRIWQQITDIFAECSIDYDKDSEITQKFYATVQNKFHYAITGNTAAEIIYKNADHAKENMGLTTWKNSPDGRILKSDVMIAKNYLDERQIKRLERTVSGYFDYIEDLVERENTFTMEEFAKSINEFLEFRKYDILRDNGKISRKQAEEKAEKESEHRNKFSVFLLQ